MGELAGFLTGWMYWYFWVIVVALEAVAGAKLIQFWLPDAPSWLVTLVILVSLTLTNMISVRSYGEFEFWFASIKVAAITVFLFLGTLYVLGLWPDASFNLSNLTAHGGFAPNGIAPILTGAVAATGFYFGAEIVTIAAAESAEPERAVARATNSVITRVLVFYVGSIFLVVCIIPWNSATIATPYVSALAAMGIPAAAQIMNVVVLTAVLSALNCGLYASSRMLFALTKRGDAPQGLDKLNQPRRAGPGHPRRNRFRLRLRRHVVRFARHGVRVLGEFLRHGGDLRLHPHRRLRAAPARSGWSGRLPSGWSCGCGPSPTSPTWRSPA